MLLKKGRVLFSLLVSIDHILSLDSSNFDPLKDKHVSPVLLDAVGLRLQIVLVGTYKEALDE